MGYCVLLWWTQGTYDLCWIKEATVVKKRKMTDYITHNLETFTSTQNKKFEYQFIRKLAWNRITIRPRETGSMDN